MKASTVDFIRSLMGEARKEKSHMRSLAIANYGQGSAELGPFDMQCERVQQFIDDFEDHISEEIRE